jgi:acyl carrier protein
MSDLRSRLLEVISRYVVDAEELAAVEAGQPFLSATSLDSLAMMTLIVEIEKAFVVRFDLNTLEETFETLDTVAAYVAHVPSQ